MKPGIELLQCYQLHGSPCDSLLLLEDRCGYLRFCACVQRTGNGNGHLVDLWHGTTLEVPCDDLL